MAESDDLEIRFRTREREGGAGCKDADDNFEDADDTIEDTRPRMHHSGHGEGDIRDRIQRIGNNGQVGGAFYDGNRALYAEPNRMTIKPEPYDGTEDWEEYISHFEICAELGRWREADKVLALAAALRGPARTFYISLGQIEKRNYAALVQKLGSRFGSTRQQNRWLSRLEMRKRQSGESVAALADDLRQMAQRAYIDLDARAQEVLALNQLYKSVTPEVKYQCTNQECKTVAEAVEVIERYEAIIGDVTEKRKLNVRLTTEHKGEGSSNNSEKDRDLENTLGGLTRRIAQLETREAQGSNSKSHGKEWQNRQSRSQYPRRDTRCFICDSPAHICRNCPYFLRYKEENGKDGQQNRQYMDTRNSTSRKNGTSNQGNFKSPLTQ